MNGINYLNVSHKRHCLMILKNKLVYYWKSTIHSYVYVDIDTQKGLCMA